MLRAKSVHGMDLLAEMLIRTIFPYPPDAEAGVPYIKKTVQEDGTVEYWCYEHQFTVRATDNGSYIELSPDWHCYDDDAVDKEKAICVLHNIFWESGS